MWLAAVWMVDQKFDLNCLSSLNIRAMQHKIGSVIVREGLVPILVERKEPEKKKIYFSHSQLTLYIRLFTSLQN